MKNGGHPRSIDHSLILLRCRRAESSRDEKLPDETVSWL